MKSFINFITSRIFLIQIVLAILLAFLLFHMSLWLTGVYSHHGEKISVPNLSGLEMSKVEKVLEEKKLKYKIIDSMYNKNATPGSILEQFPRPKSKVKRNREIKLTIATIAPKLVVLDRVKNLSLRQAIALLHKKGIGVKKLEYRTSAYTQLVLGMKLNNKRLKEGDKIYKGEEIILVVGYNVKDKLTMPNLHGLSAKYARLKALKSGINVGNIICEDCNDERDKEKATVSWQSIESGKKVDSSSLVNLLMKTSRKEEE